jgi:acyl-coenzyme A synthetase/AMP-(fatty) acid ligase/3-hydroxymyristoyl/3-hydroxydecanoyl-(acyl carrier protein) dehydratase
MTPEPRIPLARLATPDAAPPSTAVTPNADRAAWLARVGDWHAAFAAAPAGDVALHFEDASEFAAALFGAWRAGRTPWVPGDALPATRARLAERVGVFAGDAPGDVSAPRNVAPSPGPVDAALDAGTCGLVLFTSGSTGEPAAIGKTLRQLDAEVAALETVFGGVLGDACVHGTVSHQHIYGLLFRVLWPLSARRRFAPARIPFAEGLAALDAGPVAIVASPAHLKRLPDTPDWRPLAASLRAVFSSGGPLPADAAADVRRLWGRAATEVFGSTETGGIAWRATGGAGLAWTPLPGVDWRAVDGRLQVRSPHLDDVTWRETADRVRADADGGFVLLGRADRIVKIEERRISLEAIERGLLGCGLLREARVVALPGHRILLAVVAVADAAGERVLAADGRPVLVARLRHHLAGQVDPIAIPRRWRFVPALPVDARGKTAERALAALFRPTMAEPEWIARGAASASARLPVPAELAAFEGHFPQAAILPGVVLVDWAVRLAREAFGLRGGLVRMDALKFQHLVRPGADLVAELELQPGRLGFRFVSAQGAHASGRLHFDDGGEP